MIIRCSFEQVPNCVLAQLDELLYSLNYDVVGIVEQERK